MSDAVSAGARQKREDEGRLESAGWTRHRISMGCSFWEDPSSPGSKHGHGEAVEIQDGRDAAVREVMES
jgi:hypothetical protein